jgi:hypothetical protein
MNRSDTAKHICKFKKGEEMDERENGAIKNLHTSFPASCHQEGLSWDAIIQVWNDFFSNINVILRSLPD